MGTRCAQIFDGLHPPLSECQLKPWLKWGLKPWLQAQALRDLPKEAGAPSPCDTAQLCEGW